MSFSNSVNISKLKNLEIFRNSSNAQPAFFLFRSSETIFPDSSGQNDYDTWSKVFGSFSGITGKALNEENSYIKRRTIDTFNRYKDDNPGKLLFLHYNGNERNPNDVDGRYFPGHWLYYRGCLSLENIPDLSGDTVIKVENPDYFMTNWGRNSDRNEDLLIVLKGEDGKPDWY